MRRDLEVAGALRRSTAVGMWICYLVAGALYADAIRSRSAPAPLPRALALVTAAAGAGMVVAGTGAFRDVGQIAGTSRGPLVTTGVYRFSRNPQYAGAVLAGAAGAAATRSPGAAGVIAAYAAVCRWWIPAEEQMLADLHGAAYEAYRVRTPRWIGIRRAAG